VRMSRSREREREALRRAEGMRYFAHSEMERPSNPTLALLLAIEAGERAPGELTDRALRAALDACQELHALPHKGRVVAAFYSPDGQEILTRSDDRVARRWGADGRLLAEIKGRTSKGRAFHEGKWEDFEYLVESPVSAAYTRAGLRILAQQEKGFAVWD